MSSLLDAIRAVRASEYMAPSSVDAPLDLVPFVGDRKAGPPVITLAGRDELSSR
jgi:hypothetical protein